MENKLLTKEVQESLGGMALPLDVETLFKAEPPFRQVQPGFGFIGVFLRDKIRDLVQCHICGEWFSSVSQHIQLHSLGSREYKVRFGLPLTFPLTSVSLSRKLSNAGSMSVRHQNIDKIRERLMHGYKKWDDFSKKNGFYGHTYYFQSYAQANKLGLCDEQIEKRFLIVSDIVGRRASYGDIRKHDPQLCDAIQVRFGGIKEFLHRKGIERVVLPKLTWTRERIIASLRKFYSETGTVPTVKTFPFHNIRYPQLSLIRKVLGSWSRALHASGFCKVEYPSNTKVRGKGL